jgi:ABC-2 type transport system ATP-binding protein
MPLNLLSDLDITLDLSKPHALTGRNGSGKSTLCRALVGLYKVPNGRLRWSLDGKSQTTPKIGYLPSRGGLKNDLSVCTNISLVARMRGVNLSDQDVQKWLDDNGLGELGPRFPDSLSFGQVQVARIGTIVLTKPDIMVLDEPTTGLDIERSYLIDTLLENACYNGAGIIIATHDMETASNLCDSITIMDGGLVLYHGLIDELRKTTPGRRLKDCYWKILHQEGYALPNSSRS